MPTHMFLLYSCKYMTLFNNFNTQDEEYLQLNVMTISLQRTKT